MSPETVQLPRFLTPKDVAERLSLSLTAVYAIIEAGELPCIRVGAHRGRIRIEEAELIAYIEKGREMPTIVPITTRGRGKSGPAIGNFRSVLREAGWNGQSRVRS